MKTVRALATTKQDPSLYPSLDGYEVEVTAEDLPQALKQAGIVGKLVSVDNIPLGRLLQDKLLELGYKVACAESLTGGALAAEIVRFDGASRIMDESVVTYGDVAKIGLLDVDADVLAREGAVCQEVAKEMAEGVKRLSGCDLALSTTGIAGPKGDGKCNEVGLTFIGVATPYETVTYMHLFEGERDDVRRQAVLWALLHGVQALDKILADKADQNK